MSPPRLHLFEATGVEIEYMIVDRETLDVKPCADELIRAACGSIESEIERGRVAWSNELALHVIEFKTNGPAQALAGLAELFQRQVREAVDLLEPLGATLLPTGMHPWMQPDREFRRWPHEYGPVYAAFDRIFDCSGHGWANLQSVHVNLPFANDEEFGRLHAAIRVLLPLLPAIAASSPVVEGRLTGLQDTRLDVYRTNARRVPSVSGDVVPEPVFTPAAYQREVLQRIYADLAPLDPEGVLRDDWVNARGCIPRFERGSIEIRVLDVQECPRADLAIVAAVVAVVRSLVEEKLAPYEVQKQAHGGALVQTFRDAVREGGDAKLADAGHRAALGLGNGPRLSLSEAWRVLLDRAFPVEQRGEWREPLGTILEEGCLARRITHRLRTGVTPSRLRQTYGALQRCLLDGQLFRAGG